MVGQRTARIEGLLQALDGFYGALGGPQWYHADGWRNGKGSLARIGVQEKTGAILSIKLIDNNVGGKRIFGISTLRR